MGVVSCIREGGPEGTSSEMIFIQRPEKSRKEATFWGGVVLGSGEQQGQRPPAAGFVTFHKIHPPLVQPGSQGRLRRELVFEQLFRAGDVIVINQSRPRLRGSAGES